jgi:bacteriocin-like protein
MTKEISQKFETINNQALSTIEGGLGYRWACSDGTKSAWHAKKATAQANANSYMKIHRGVVCSVFHS